MSFSGGMACLSHLLAPPPSPASLPYPAPNPFIPFLLDSSQGRAVAVKVLLAMVMCGRDSDVSVQGVCGYVWILSPLLGYCSAKICEVP